MSSRAFSALVVVLLLLAAAAGLALGALSAPGRDGGVTAGPASTPTGPRVSLDAQPDAVARLAAVELSGALTPAAAGARVQVQRQEDGQWVDFPVRTSTKADGSFSVTVKSGRPGDNLFRVAVEAEAGTLSSPPVTVSVG